MLKKRCEASHWGASEERTRTTEEWLANPRTSSHLHGLLDISTSTHRQSSLPRLYESIGRVSRISSNYHGNAGGVHGKQSVVDTRYQAHRHTHSRRSRPLPMPNEGRSTILGSMSTRSPACATALEKPHCGMSGLPFMKRTTLSKQMKPGNSYSG